MKVIIPMAGEGTRMRPHTHTKPKPLIEFAGKSCLSHILDEVKIFDDKQKELAAKKKKNSAVSEIIFITGRLQDKIEDFVKKNYDFKVRFIEQKVKDGSAGAVRLAAKFIDEPVIVIYVDTVFEVDLDEINQLSGDESGIIWAKTVEDYQRFGVCVLDNDGYISKIVEKPKEPISKKANIGLYYTKDYKELFEGIDYIFDNGISLKGEYYLVDAFNYMIETKGAKIRCPEVEGWYDAGKPETILESNRELLKKGRDRVIPTENSVIIPPVYIADGVKIKDSVIGPYVSISAGSEITNCIIHDSIIGVNSKIRDVLLGQSVVGDNVEISDNPKQLNLGDHSVVSFGEKKQ